MLRLIEQGCRKISRFCDGLLRDAKAVTAAVTLPWSNGQVEGQVHRLKLVKRQMYGRAKFNLLRRRVLPYVPAVADLSPERRRVSMILRHLALEFTDLLPLSFCQAEVVC